MGAVVLTVTSVVVYQQVTYVQVVQPPAVVEPAPVVEQTVPSALAPMDFVGEKDTGHFLPMPTPRRP